MSEPNRSSTPASAMPAEFGVATATFIIVASMVGTGVLTTSGFTVAGLKSNELMLWLWLLGGVVAACGALTLCELTAALPETGGDYVYLREAYGPLVAFLSGWVSFLIGFAAPSAAAAFGAAKYLVSPWHLDPSIESSVQRGLATLLIVGFALIHTAGRRQTAHVQGWITGIKLLILVGFVLLGLAIGWPKHANLLDRPPITAPVFSEMMFSLVYISYAYIGWNSASYLAGEFKNPQKQLPRAILLGTLEVILLYLGLNVVYALALSSDDIQAIVNDPSNTRAFKAEVVAPIAEIAAKRLFGARISEPFSFAIGLMLLSSLSAYVLTGPRVIYAMASARQFPRIAARLSSRTGTPVVATVLQVMAALVLLWTGSFESLVIYASVGLSIFSMLAVGAIFVLRVKQPNLVRPFRTPGYPVTPAIYLLVTLGLTRAAFLQRPLISTYALLSILAGVPFYFLQKRATARSIASKNSL